MQIVARDLAQRKFNELERLQTIIGASFAQLKIVRETGEISGKEIDLLIERTGLLYSFVTIMESFITHITETLSENGAAQTK